MLTDNPVDFFYAIDTLDREWSSGVMYHNGTSCQCIVLAVKLPDLIENMKIHPYQMLSTCL